MACLRMLLAASSTGEAAARSLERIADSLQQISKALTATEFWNTQWFAALIGASSAILVLLIDKWMAWRKHRSREIFEYCKWLNEQLAFRAPDVLLYDAKRTSYGCTTKDVSSGEVTTVPEKRLGEKMAIELRRELKWWRAPSKQLRTLFREYEGSLRAFDQLESGDRSREAELLRDSKDRFCLIEQYAYDFTGDDQWTAR